MDSTNNPQGTGYTPEQAATHIEALLDSPPATTETVDADSETEVSQTLETETDEVNEQLETDSEEQSVEEDSDTDSDETAEAEQSDEEEEQTTDKKILEIPDDATIVINGVEMTGEEAKKGWMLHQDYTRKRQEEAALVKETVDRYVVDNRNWVEIREGTSQHMQDISEVLAAEFGLQQPDWDALRAEDKSLYIDVRAEYDKRQQSLTNLDQQIKAQRERNAAARAEEAKITLAREVDTLQQKIPEFKDLTLFGKVGKHLVENWGFTPEEVSSISDHRFMAFAYDSYRKGQTAAKLPDVVKKIEKKGPLISPGSSKKSSTPVVSAESRDRALLAKTGDREAAARLIARQLYRS